MDRINHPRTLAWEPLDSEHVLACPRVPYADVQARVERAGKGKWLEHIRRNAKHDCCRDPANLDIEAWLSKPSEVAPDVYKFYCKVCEAAHRSGEDRGYCHVMFCVGGTHPLALHGLVNRSERPDLFEIRPHWGSP